MINYPNIRTNLLQTHFSIEPSWELQQLTLAVFFFRLVYRQLAIENITLPWWAHRRCNQVLAEEQQHSCVVSVTSAVNPGQDRTQSSKPWTRPSSNKFQDSRSKTQSTRSKHSLSSTNFQDSSSAVGAGMCAANPGPWPGYQCGWQWQGPNPVSQVLPQAILQQLPRQQQDSAT